MFLSSHPSLRTAEWCCTILILLAAVLIPLAMVHVAADFGFTALGEPIVASLGP